MDSPIAVEQPYASEPAAAAPTRRAPARTGLLTRLFGLVVLSILPALAVQTYNEIELRQSRGAEARNEALRLAKFASGELDRIVDNGRGLLVTLANLPALRQKDAAACTAYVTALKTAFPQYRAIGAVDLTGNAFCTTAAVPPGTNATGPNVEDALRTGEFTVGKYVIGRLVKEPVLPLILPYRGPDDRIAGVVYVSLDPHWLADYFQTTKPLGPQSTLAITDKEGTIVVRIPDNQRFVGTSLVPTYAKHVFAEEPGTDEIVGLDGIPRILGYVPINQQPIGFYVGVGLAKSDAFAAVNRASIAGFLLIASGLCLGLVVAWLGARHFLFRPIDKLVGAAAQWGRGNFATRADIGPGNLELTQLGVTFDTMAALLQRQQEENAVLLTSLEQRVEERTQALEQSNRELRIEMERREEAEAALRHAQKIEALGHLTGGIAHDFNNTLQVILGNLGMVARRLDETSADRVRLGELIRTAMRAGERAAMTTRQLLAFGRRQPLAPTPVDINRLISGMQDLLQRTLGEAIEVEIVLGARLWQALLDPNELESAVINLAVNARDAMAAGGKLTIETANTYLDAAYAATEEDVRPGQYAVISVSDTGSGMSREIADKAFDPFFTTKDVGAGSGLGLSQVYGFIKQSGGHAKIYSEPGEGTTVKLYLPRLIASDAADGPTDMAATQEPRQGQGEVVLVVEDEPDVRRYASEALRELGYRVVEAPDGEAALRLIDGQPDISLLFTDVGLPGGINGRQLSEAALRRRPDLKVLYTTGYARNAIVHQGRLDPGVELIVKPFTYAELAARIRDVLAS
ncbi:MAG: response regulator [Alphaproteobacteria bacterium]|nr:response regulator [Alphaproteobacteria bacterium]